MFRCPYGPDGIIGDCIYTNVHRPETATGSMCQFMCDGDCVHREANKNYLLKTYPEQIATLRQQLTDARRDLDLLAGALIKRYDGVGLISEDAIAAARKVKASVLADGKEGD